MQNLDYLDPTNDYVFKRMLCESQPALLSMVNAILQPAAPVRHAIIQNSEVLAPEPDGHNIRLDILTQLEDGSQINIEMQSWTHPALENRLLYYFSSLYGSNLDRGQSYKRLNPVYVVAWTQKALFNDGPLQSVFELRERRTSRVLTPHCQIQVLQLDKLQHPVRPDQSLLSHWAHFLANRDPSRYDEIADLDPGIHSAMTTLKALSQDEKTRFLAKAREDAARMQFESNCVSRELGLEEGRQLGLEEGRQQGHIQGEAHALLRLLSKRFGDLPESIRQDIERANLDQIRSWFDLSLDAHSIDDIFGNSR